MRPRERRIDLFVRALSRSDATLFDVLGLPQFFEQLACFDVQPKRLLISVLEEPDRRKLAFDNGF